MKGLFTGAVFVAAGVIGTQFLAGFIPVLPFGPWGVLAAKAGAAYGAGMVAHKLGVSQQNATFVTLGGLAGVVQDAYALLRSKFPDILQASAVQLPTPVPMQAVPMPMVPSPVQALNGYKNSADMYGTGMRDITLWRQQQGLWGRGSGMGDVVLYGRR